MNVAAQFWANSANLTALYELGVLAIHVIGVVPTLHRPSLFLKNIWVIVLPQLTEN